ncbi:MAG: hypothetical protein KJ626_10795 [Verrucomicrobia bacterium]|nr:hypothetical protein [Verrucomicrobiota bacterium]
MRKHIWRAGLLLFVLALVAAFMFDFSFLQKQRQDAAKPLAVTTTEDLQRLVLGMEGPRFSDPEGLFSLVRPAEWRVSRKPQSDAWNVIFRSANGPDLRVMAVKVEYNNFNSLLKRVKGAERDLDLDMNLKVGEFKEWPAVWRSMTLPEEKLLTLDFMESHVAHHIQFSAPHAIYDRYLPVITNLLQTYEPLRRE